MKATIKAYLIVFILCLLVLSVLSFYGGVGYVYLFFAGWELQTNVWVLSGLILLISALIQTIYEQLKHFSAQRKNKVQSILSFDTLQPYEKITVLWLLDAQIEQAYLIKQYVEKSDLFKHIVAALYLQKKGEFEQAYLELDQVPAAGYEIAEIIYIDTLLLEGRQDPTFERLEKLSEHKIAIGLHELESSYHHSLSKLWGRFAIQFPWEYLRTIHYGQLTAKDNTLWLTAILQQFESSTLEQREELKSRYLLLNAEHILHTARENKILWLKILVRCSDVDVIYEQLVNDLLEDRFDQDVFFMWFKQKIKSRSINYFKMEQQVHVWEQRYAGMPIFSFVRWHIYQATERSIDADALLKDFPDDVLMSYLRIKSNIQYKPELVDQLNNIFETNTRFLKI